MITSLPIDSLHPSQIICQFWRKHLHRGDIAHIIKFYRAYWNARHTIWSLIYYHCQMVCAQRLRLITFRASCRKIDFLRTSLEKRRKQSVRSTLIGCARVETTTLINNAHARGGRFSKTGNNAFVYASTLLVDLAARFWQPRSNAFMPMLMLQPLRSQGLHPILSLMMGALQNCPVRALHMLPTSK